VKNKLIYITNTRIPSEKANSYQSMQMCNSFAKIYDKVEMWVPNGINTKEMEPYENNPYKFYGIEKTFDIKRLFTIDYWWIHNLNQRVWSHLAAITFALAVLFKLKKEDKETPIFTRDWYVLKILLFGKKIGFIENKIFYEAHKYVKKLISNYKNCNGLVVTNNYLKIIHEKQNINYVLSAYNGVNANEYNDILNYTNNKNKGKYTLVYTGNLFAWKGVYTLVDSVKYIDKNIELIIVGGSKEVFDDFKNYINKKNAKNILLKGHLPKRDTLKYIEQADILILPNSKKDKWSKETSPIKLFEYMMSRRPIIASNVDAICEVLKDKKNAILFEADNPKDLGDKINWTLENDCTDIVKQAFKDVQEYTWDKRAEKIKNFMESL
jgi:glycosyltransferase involved in cell wall biosynthesis